MRLNSTNAEEKCPVCKEKNEQIKLLNSQIERMDKYINSLIDTKKGEAVEDVVCAVAG
jgi:hypothetical protein